MFFDDAAEPATANDTKEALEVAENSSEIDLPSLDLSDLINTSSIK